MSLRKKTLLITGFVFVALLAFVSLVGRLVLSDSFQRLEERDTRRNTDRVLDALAAKFKAMDRGDWSNWDDAYQFVAEPSQAFIDVNTTDQAFVAMHVNLIAFLDQNGDIVYAKAFDLQQTHELSLTPALQDQLATHTFLPADVGLDKGLSGIASLSEGSMLIVARPILDSNGQGPPHGTLIFGRYLDEPEIEDWAHTTHLSLDIRPIDDPQLPEDFFEARGALADSSNTFVRARDDQVVSGYRVLEDVHAHPALILRVSLPRDIYSEGRASQQLLLVSLAFVGFIFSALSLLVLDRTVLVRLTRLNADVSRIGSSGELGTRVAAYGRDELARLAAGINHMLAALEQSEQKLRRVERRNLLGGIPDLLFVFDQAGTCVEYKSNDENASGLAPNQVVGTNLRQSGLAPEFTTRSLKLIEVAIRTHEPQRFEHALTPAAPDNIYESRLVRLNDTEVLAIVRDITPAKRAEAEVRRQSARAEALAHIAARLNKQLDLATVLHAVCEETARALKVPVVLLRLYEPKCDELHVAHSFGLPQDFGEFEWTSRSFYAPHMDKEDNLVVIQDVQSLNESPNRKFHATFNIRTVVSAMMLRGSQLVGALSIYTMGETRQFSEDELALLRGLTDQAAQAILNAQLFDETQRRLRRLRGLRAIDVAITASVDLEFTLARVLDEVMTQLQVDAADILTFNEHEHLLQYVAGQGFRSGALKHTRLRLGEGYAGTAALERRVVKVPVLMEAIGGLARSPLLPDEDFVSYYAVPLLAKGQIQGVLEVFHRSRLNVGEEWEEFLEALAGQCAIAIDNAELFNNLQRSNVALRGAYEATLEGWSRALDLRDRETEGHTQRVTEMTVRLARAMQVDEEELAQIRRGALLHDIGKMGVPDRILLKPGPLTDEEWPIMRQHPTYAYQLLSPISYLRAAMDIPYCHHEKWDGTGYPQGLKGEQIPLSARIFAVVDVWDALRSDRPYRAAWPEAKVRGHIGSLVGTHFDPQVVEAFLRMMHPD